jgi:hypothetical protein
MWRSKPGMAPAMCLVKKALEHPGGIDRDEQGRIVAVRLRPRQFRTLANRVLGLAGALEEAGG